MKRVKVLHVIGNLDSDSGGAQRVIYGICKYANNQKVDQNVCYLFGSGGLSKDFPNETEIYRAAGRAKYSPLTIYRLKKIIERMDPNVINVHSPVSHLYFRLAKGTHSKRHVIVTMHNVFSKYPTMWKLSEKVLLPGADKVVGVSETVTKIAKKKKLIQTENITTIKNAVDIDRIDRKNRVPLNKIGDFNEQVSEKFILATVGSLSRQKGHEYLIRAMVEIKEKLPQVRLLIIGGGGLRKRLKALVIQKNLSKQVKLLGRKENAVGILKSVDMFVFPSLWEGLSIALLEAMAVGLPIVASDLPQMREALADAGEYAEPADPKELSQKLIETIHNEDKRAHMSHQARKRAKAKFDVRKRAQSYEELYLSYR